MNENVCELPPARCGFTRRPSDADLRKIQEATGLPKHVIDRAFSSRGGSRSKKGGLSDWQKDKVCSAVLVLAAGGTVFYAVPLAEAFLVQIGLLPVLCDQNIMEHIGINLIALGTGGATESCAQRASRYNVIAATIITTLGATGLFTRNSIRLHYDLAHAYVKAYLFGDEEAVAAAEAALRTAQTQVQQQAPSTRVAQQQPTSPSYDPNVPPQLSPVIEQQVSPPRGRTTGRRGTRTVARSRSASDSSGTDSQTGRRRSARSRGKGTKRSNAKGVRVTRKHKKRAKKHHKKHAKKHTKKHTKKHARKHRGRKTGKRGRARR